MGLLLLALKAATAARIVSISSDIATSGRIDFDDLQSTRRFGLVSTYGRGRSAAGQSHFQTHDPIAPFVKTHIGV